MKDCAVRDELQPQRVDTGLPPPSIGVVVIGRNEGERLRRCLESVDTAPGPVVYVDSGSIDNSLSIARQFGVEIAELNMSIPFCAARARNAGYRRLSEIDSQLSFVQFVDGDCEVTSNWLLAAASALSASPDVAIVAGRLHERFPEQSLYNRLGDLEWNSAGIGDVEAVGGIFMIRRVAFDETGGFDPTVVAGEEPELCHRLARQGWKIRRLDRDMARHDLAMTRFGQWWTRTVRFGYGSADVSRRFGLPRFRRSNLRARLWTMWLFVVVTLAVATLIALPHNVTLWAELALVSLWFAQLARIALRTSSAGHSVGLATTYAFFVMLSQWPQMLGQVLYWTDRHRNRSFRLVEYKTADAPKREAGVKADGS
jgi:glycosyltransferase involved in cell wall biosynthesis